MAVTDDLITWLRGQLDDDERVARDSVAQQDCGGFPPIVYTGTWRAEEFHSQGIFVFDGDTSIVGGYQVIPAHAEHIARWDPARVLAEIDAKRRIIDHVAPIADGTGGWRWFQGSESEAEAVIKMLALPYAEREGYRDEWRP